MVIELATTLVDHKSDGDSVVVVAIVLATVLAIALVEPSDDSSSNGVVTIVTVCACGVPSGRPKCDMSTTDLAPLSRQYLIEGIAPSILCVLVMIDGSFLSLHERQYHLAPFLLVDMPEP